MHLVLLLVLLIARFLATVLVQLELFGSGLHHVTKHLRRAYMQFKINVHNRQTSAWAKFEHSREWISTRDVRDGNEDDGHQVDLSEQRLVLDGLRKKQRHSRKRLVYVFDIR